jgi:lysophospholipase L1-like esterase
LQDRSTVVALAGHNRARANHLRGTIAMRRSSVVVLLLAVMVVAAPLARSRAQSRGESHFARWEKAIATFEEKDRQSPPPHHAVVFVGSSSIRFWDVAKSFPGVEAINRGFGGSELADSAHFAPRIVLPYEPRTVVLYAGDNDLAAGKTPEQVAADFREFTRVVLARLPKTRIIYLSIKPSPYRWSIVDKGRAANELIAAQCKSDDHLIFLDVGTPLLGSDGKPRRELFRSDGLHLNEKGYEVWAGLLKPYLR